MQVLLYQLAVNIDYRHIFINDFNEENQNECKLQWADFLKFCEEFKLTPKEYPEVGKYSYYYSAVQDEVVVLQGTDALKLLAAKPEQVRIKQAINVDLDPAAIFDTVSSKAEAACVGGHSVYNTKCEVHMPGQALSTYNEVCLLEDSCTDVLQAKLSEGWRIIAGCPQPDQRRPDYILGRFNPDCNGHDSAVR